MDKEQFKNEAVTQMLAICKEIVAETLSIVKSAIDSSGKIEINGNKLPLEERFNIISIYLDEHIKSFKNN